MLAVSIHLEQPSEMLKSIPNLDDVTLYVIDLKQRGSVAAKISFPSDSICLSHNVGVSIHGDLLAVLSLLRQHIKLFSILADGSMRVLMTIGVSCHADDTLFLARTMADLPARRSPDASYGGFDSDEEFRPALVAQVIQMPVSMADILEVRRSAHSPRHPVCPLNPNPHLS